MAAEGDDLEQIDDHVRALYTIKNKLGKGAYGIVWRAVEISTNRVCALKKIFGAFRNHQDAQRTYREVVFLQQLKHHDNVVELVNVHRSDNSMDLYLVFEYVETDLHAVIKAKILQPVHKQWIMYQLFRSLKFMHTGGLLHRDIKPSNLLLNSDSQLKVCDFGLSRSIKTDGQDTEAVMTDYVATRWYRSPELLLGSGTYTTGVDMWACGCILGELLGNKPMFQGKSTTDQITKIVELTGTPSRRDVDSLKSEYAIPMLESLGLFDSSSSDRGSVASGDGGGGGGSAGGIDPASTPRSEMTSMDIIRKLHARKRQDESTSNVLAADDISVLEKKYPDAPKSALVLLKQLLNFDPTKRISAEVALASPYVEEFRDIESEVNAETPFVVPMDDSKTWTVEEYREQLFKLHTEVWQVPTPTICSQHDHPCTRT